MYNAYLVAFTKRITILHLKLDYGKKSIKVTNCCLVKKKNCLSANEFLTILMLNMRR